MLPLSSVPVLLLRLVRRSEDASLLLLHVTPDVDRVGGGAHVGVDPVHAFGWQLEVVVLRRRRRSRRCASW